MPFFDKTGPEGKGPLTGQGLGKCLDKDTTEKAKRPGLNLFRGFRRFGRLGRNRGKFNRW